MNQEYTPDFDEMSDDELDEFMDAWKEANEDLLWAVQQEMRRPKTLMTNPQKVSQIDNFLKCLGNFLKRHETKKRRKIEITQDVGWDRTLSVDLKIDVLSTLEDRTLHEMFMELVRLSDSFELSGLANDYVKLSFVFENYYIEIPNKPQPNA